MKGKKHTLENIEVFQDIIQKRIYKFILNHKAKIVSVITIITIAAVVFFGYTYYLKEQNKLAEMQLFPAIFLFEKDSLEQALLGDGGNFTDGLLAISKEYKMTDAGNLANFYIGTIYLKQEKYNSAIAFLKKFSSKDNLIQARTYSLIADAYIEQKNLSKAINFYKKAVNYKPNEGFTPDYLMKLALAYKMNKNYEKAAEAYNEIIQEYNSSDKVNSAKKRLASLSSTFLKK